MVNRGEVRSKAIAALGAFVMTAMSVVATVSPATQAHMSASVQGRG